MLSLEDQERDLERIEKTEGLHVVERYVGKVGGESQSAHKRGRPIFTRIMQQIEDGKANALLVWHPNRLARNAYDGGWIITAMDEGKLVEVKTVGRTYHNNSNDKFMLSLEFGMAKKSSDDNGDAVKRGLKSKNEMGWYPSKSPLGYLNTIREGKGQNTIIKDPERFEHVQQMWRLMLTGQYTAPQILEIANTQWGFRTREGQPLCRSAIYKIFNHEFYSGRYEYPRSSGEWYHGKHEPMVSVEEFERVQAILGNKKRPRPLTRRFAYTGIMQCGHCGASITAEEKVKRHKNGNTHHYVYYRCTKRVDPRCPEKTVELKELTKQADIIIRGITISDKFRDWAIKYLHEIRKDEARSHEQVISNKQKRVLEITKQLDALLLRYTSPANLTGDLISDDEYKSAKRVLVDEKASLEGDLQAKSAELAQWLELSERTFNFARYASVWFFKGDLETRRAIFACLGSNFSLKDRKLNIHLRKPFKLLFEHLDEIEREIMEVRTPENDSKKGQVVTFVPSSLIGRRVRDSNPRGCYPYLVSSEALSATQPTLQGSYTIVPYRAYVLARTSPQYHIFIFFSPQPPSILTLTTPYLCYYDAMLHFVSKRDQRWLSRLLHRAFYDVHSPMFYPLNNFLAGVTLLSVLAFVLDTVPSLAQYELVFLGMEYISVAIFTIEYMARLLARRDDVRTYMVSPFGIIDLLAILPTYLGLANLVFLKTTRVLRILRLLRMVRLAELAEIPFERLRTLDDHAHIYSRSVQIYFMTLFCAITIFGTFIYVAERGRPEFASIPLGMVWAAKVTMGGVAQHMPYTIWGDIITIVTRFTGLALFGLMLSIIGNSVHRILFGSSRLVR